MSAKKPLSQRVVAAGVKEARRHETYREDADGWTVCKCRIPFPGPEDWADHYAGFVLDAAVAVVRATEVAP